MPMHNFICKNESCNHLEEDVIVKWGINYMVCPKCKSQMVRRLTSYNFHLRGGSWAKDGYK